MARLPTIRKQYARDAAELYRLAEAINRDQEAPVEWKRVIMTRLYEVGDLLKKETLRRLGDQS